MSATLNEPARLASGLAVWQWGTTAVYRVNPPLVHALAAVPAFLSGMTLESSGTLHVGAGKLASSLVRGNPEKIHAVIVCGRLVCVAISAMGVVACYALGKRLYSQATGFVAAILWCFCRGQHDKLQSL